MEVDASDVAGAMHHLRRGGPPGSNHDGHLAGQAQQDQGPHGHHERPLRHHAAIFRRCRLVTLASFIFVLNVCHVITLLHSILPLGKRCYI